MLRSAQPVAGWAGVCGERIRHSTYAWEFGGQHFCRPLEGPRWGRQRGGAFFLSVRTGGRREGRMLWPEDGVRVS